MQRLIQTLCLLAAIATFPLACGRTVEQQESETHFLRACSGTCTGGLECICGVCTQSCDSAGSCSDLAQGASCLPTGAECGAEAPSDVCGVACDGDADCAALGQRAECVVGTCSLSQSSSPDGNGGEGGQDGNGSAGNGGDGGTSNQSCEAFADPEAAPVTLTVVNQRSGPVVLGGPSGCQPDNLSITSKNTVTPGSWQGSACNGSCEVVRMGAFDCPGICLYPPVVVIEAGGSAELEWNGLVGESVSLPEQCCEGEDCGSECFQLSVAAEGAYMATIAYADVTEAEAADCLADALQCPIEPFGTEPVERLELDFELGSESIVLEIPAEEPAAMSCDDYTREVPMDSIPITVTNRRDTAVVLGGVNDGCLEYVAIRSLDDAAPGSFSGWGCGGTCASAHLGSFTCGACVTADAIVLEPGESTELEWTGVLLNQIPFAEECCDDGSLCYGECAMPSAAAPGPFSATVELMEASEEEAAACRADAQGCPLLPQNGAPVTAVEMPFDFTGGAIDLEIPAP